MIVAVAGPRGCGWPDLGWSLITGGWCGATSDELLNHGDPVGTGSVADLGYAYTDQIVPPDNNFTESWREENTGNTERTKFWFALPNSRSDWQGRFQCSRSGWWSGARFKVVVDGLPYISIFAPRLGRVNRDVDPNSWGG